VEQQAFCRAFRIGQQQETFVTRFVIRNTVDEMLYDLQEKKKKESIDTTIGDDVKRLDNLPLKDLLRLFGPDIDEDGKESIIDDEEESAENDTGEDGKEVIIDGKDESSDDAMDADGKEFIVNDEEESSENEDFLDASECF
jgi:hypothetical protein